MPLPMATPRLSSGGWLGVGGGMGQGVKKGWVVYVLLKCDTVRKHMHDASCDRCMYDEY